MPGQKESPRMPFGLADLPCPCGGLRGGSKSRRRVSPRILHKMHMQNFTAPLRVDSAAPAANKKIFIWERDLEEWAKEMESGVAPLELCGQWEFRQGFKATCCDFLYGLSLITTQAKENTKRLE